MSPRAIDSLLTAHFAPAPGSFYEGVRRLLPGHLLVFEPGGWMCGGRLLELSAPFVAPPPPRDMKILFEDATAEVDWLLTEAVKRQLVADVPVGVFASGGIDSTPAPSKLVGPGTEGDSAFALGFREASHSELPHAEKAGRGARDPGDSDRVRADGAGRGGAGARHVRRAVRGRGGASDIRVGEGGEAEDHGGADGRRRGRDLRGATSTTWWLTGSSRCGWGGAPRRGRSWIGRGRCRRG